MRRSLVGLLFLRFSKNPEFFMHGLFQILAAVVSFPTVQEAVDTTVNILQNAVPVARMGTFLFLFISPNT